MARRVETVRKTYNLPPDLLARVRRLYRMRTETEALVRCMEDATFMDEVVRAVRKIRPGEEITDETIRGNLDHPELPDIDLVVRTSGEQRTSNFFLWQSAYAEWMFIDREFPEFSGDDLGRAIDAFQGRQRRFGA